MATEVSVELVVTPAEVPTAEAAAAACLDWFDEVDRRLSRFRPESDLSLLNASPGAWHSASDLLYVAVARAVAAAHASAGRFDPTLLGCLEALGYDRDFALIAHGETCGPDAADASGVPALPPLPYAPGWRDIEFDSARRRIRLPRGVRLDLGGIAKGWAADVAVEHYCAPFANVLVNVGGDMRMRGGPEVGVPWSVGIRDPQQEVAMRLAAAANTPLQAPPSYAANVLLSRGGLATSGAVWRWWLRAGERVHHLLDPRTGLPARLAIDSDAGASDNAAPDGSPLLMSVTALAPTAARAEVATKVAVLRGHPASLHAVEAAWERYGAVGPDDDADVGVALIVTLSDGAVVVSSNIDAYLATWGTDGAALPLHVR